MRTINIGKLNKRITFRKYQDEKDEMNQSRKKLADYKTVWGSLYPVRGREFYEIQKLQGEVTHKCYVRYLEGIDSNCFLSCGGKVYQIESVMDMDMEHKMLEILCSEHINREAVKGE